MCDYTEIKANVLYKGIERGRLYDHKHRDCSMTFPDILGSTNTTGETKQRWTPDVRPGYLSRFFLKRREECDVVFLDDDTGNLTTDQQRFLAAFGFPQGSKIKIKPDKNADPVDVVTGFSWYDHTIMLGQNRIINVPCGKYLKMTPFARVVMLNHLSCLNANSLIVDNRNSLDSEWYMSHRVPKNIIDALASGAHDAFRAGVVDFYNTPLGEPFSDGGSACRFCTIEKEAKERGDKSNSASTRKIARTVIALKTITLKSGDVTNPLLLHCVGTKGDGPLRIARDITKGGRQKGRPGLQFSQYTIARSGDEKSPSVGDSLIFTDELTKEAVLALNPNAIIDLTHTMFDTMLLENSAYRFHMLRAAAPTVISSLDDARNKFAELFPDGYVLPRTADYFGITFPRVPSYIRTILGEQTNVPTPPNAKAEELEDDGDVPF